MIIYTTGDMFTSGAQCLVNAVNCEGYMGKGIAYQFKLKFPENNKSYVKACKNGNLRPGSLHTYVENGTTIVNFPTKDKWRENSEMSYIETGLDSFLRVLPELGVRSVAIPPLGCGNGGLHWLAVKKIIEDKLQSVATQYDFLIYEPSGNHTQKSSIAPKLSVSSLILMKLKMGLNKHTKLRLQKAAYFMNMFAHEEYFSFQKYKFGPYSHSIDIIGRRIGEYQSHFEIKDTETTYQMLYKTICTEKTDQTLKRLLPAIAKAVQYVNQIENDHDLEGISTALFLIHTKQNQSEEQLIDGFKMWSEVKAARFSEDEIKNYIKYLMNTDLVKESEEGKYTLISV